MVVATLIGLAVLAGVGIGTVNALATLFHWISISAGVLVGGGLFYQLVVNKYIYRLDFDSDYIAVASAGLISGVSGFLSYVLIESVFTALGWISALTLLVIIGASVILGPGLVFSFFGSAVSLIADIAGGE